MTTIEAQPLGSPTNKPTPEPTRQKLLSPAERSSEVLFGLIMVLTFTGSLSVATAERQDVREMLIGAIGCNLAWGLVDAVMYLMATLTARRRNSLVGRRFIAATNIAAARSTAGEVFPEAALEVISDSELEQIRQRMAAAAGRADPPALAARDFAAAAAVFALVFLCTLPVVLPFVIVPDAYRALRLSNGVAIVLLYLAGHSLGRFSGGRPWRTGMVMVALGLVLVAITIALGG